MIFFKFVPHSSWDRLLTTCQWEVRNKHRPHFFGHREVVQFVIEVSLDFAGVVAAALQDVGIVDWTGIFDSLARTPNVPEAKVSL